ncbi:MAG: PAS domain-containing protein [Armatimonadota bacterium]
MLLFVGLEFLVLRRVARASKALAQVAATGDVAARVPPDGDDELGRLVGGINHALTAIEQNVAAQQAAAREVEHLQRFLDSVIAYTPLALIAKEFPSGRYIIWNQAAAELFGRTAEEVLGKDARCIFPPEQAEQRVARDREVIASGKVFDSPQETIQTPDGVTPPAAYAGGASALLRGRRGVCGVHRGGCHRVPRPAGATAADHGGTRQVQH